MSYQFKNSQWQARKKELKSRRQSQSRKFNNIKAQVQINNSAFNCNNNYISDLSIEAPPSLKPAKRYCDVTGFEAKYKDPVTQLYYCDSIVFNYIRNCPKASAETYLNIRGCTQKLIS
ncbi:unnamed protein product (macronuclear) [Paramecium tetraurelia]|uniref:Vps72/YL1 C-terminal domain-containing protein n=1 Tax=Paramecium tetraurelia TaxID=5888 RepID=A0E5E2_PARTE|nr:uncharacterized protein GSPATT00023686001 [Paramecium tetraurelia]CAK90509.1 unnamed protein product [Paramecium tetraurelia]|eukprot:XP_001457906.1 hypothetical protein (macronuclear) [Paramecium tetraurelia strain d4-2]